jgi:hypothetical protein
MTTISASVTSLLLSMQPGSLRPLRLPRFAWHGLLLSTRLIAMI